MAYVTYKNILEDSSELVKINKDYLTECTYEYTRQLDNSTLYHKILHEKVVIYKNKEKISVGDWCLHLS